MPLALGNNNYEVCRNNPKTVLAIAEKEEVQDFRLGVVEEDGKQQMQILVSDDKLQSVLEECVCNDK